MSSMSGHHAAMVHTARKASLRNAQLRRAKRAQRARDAAAGLLPCQVKLHAETARLLRTALAIPGAEAEIAGFLDELVVDAGELPCLRDLLWNRADRRILARDAFDLYERNWRFVDVSSMTPTERTTVERLAVRFGAGLLNVPGG